MKKILLILFILSGTIPVLFAQQNKINVVEARIIDGDTIAQISLIEVEIFSLKVPETKRARKKLTKYIKNVKKVYPYAKLAGIQLRKYEYQLENATTEKEKRKIMKKAEQEIKEEYGEDLKQLTFSQGKILIKLIDRETGDTSFELVQELRGKFTAFFYQTFARIWGYNLKAEYDPSGEDEQLEKIVKMIERGQI